MAAWWWKPEWLCRSSQKVKISFHSFLGKFFRELEKTVKALTQGGGGENLKLVIKNQPTADTNYKPINSNNSTN